MKRQICCEDTNLNVRSVKELIGGDGTLRVWDMEDGKQIAQCDCLERKAIRRCRMFPNSSSKVLSS